MVSFSALLHVGLFALLTMVATWGLQLRTRNIGFVDITWSACLAVAAIYYSYTAMGGLAGRLLVALLGGIWGFRLAIHLLARTLHEEEDGRYAHLRKHWNDDQRKIFGFFAAQALLIVLFSVPFLVAANNPHEHLGPWMIAGLLVWMVALGGEALADWQLTRFRSNRRNKGQVCRDGLWAYSRHPNYFFEWLHWFSYVLLAASAPMGWLAWLGPILMGISLNWVTGIPYVEAQALRSRGERYRRYQREVSRFIPWFPRPAAPEE